jgi:urea carboxylase
MEGPGGYQFVGRTLQMWNRYRQTAEFTQPWLLRFFDQIKFYEVSAEELLTIRRDFPRGRYPLKIEEIEFSLADYNKLVDEHSDEILVAKERQQAAFEAERQRWIESGQANFSADSDMLLETGEEEELPDYHKAVESLVSGNVWQMLVNEGEQVKAGQPLLIIESMKMEIEVLAPHAGVVINVCREAGQQVRAGQRLLVLGE